MPPEPPPLSLTHLKATGEVHMVEVGERPSTRREARAEGCIQMRPEVLALVMEGRAPKGDVLAVARVASSRRSSWRTSRFEITRGGTIRNTVGPAATSSSC